MDVGRQSRFAVNGVTVDLGNETIHDAAGSSVPLRAQAFAVLRYLYEHAGQLVSKDALMEAVWPRVAVTDDSLVQCIHEIRRVLGDESHSVLKTMPRRGYQLVLPPSGESTVPPPASRTRPRPLSPPWALGSLAAILILVITGITWFFFGRSPEMPPTGPPAIAVLPFDNLGGDPAQSYFADGITEDLITDLSKIPGLFVIARNSVWEYRDRPVNLGLIADELGVRYVLEGSVRREGDRLRINAQLIDARNGLHL